MGPVMVMLVVSALRGGSVDDDVIQFGVPCVRFNRFMMGFVVLVIRFFRWFMVAV